MRKRSSYRPKTIHLDNMEWIKTVFKKVGSLPKESVTLKLKNRISLDVIVRGEGTKDNLDEMIACFNMAEAIYRVNPKLGLDYAQEIKAAQDAIYALGKRFLNTNKIVFTGPEMMAVKSGMEIHDAQLDEVTVKEMEQAIALVNRIILNKQARPIAEVA